MKKTFNSILIAFALILAFLPKIWSQTSCLPEGITFTTQEEIDNFPVNYPGCTEIEGGLLISGPNIIRLDSLYQIKSIGEHFQIIGTQIESLNGLQNLYPDYFIIRENNKLKSLVGLEHLDSINFLSIILNDSLKDLKGLDNLVHVRELTVQENYALISLVGLEKLKSVVTVLSFAWLNIPNFHDLVALESIGILHIWSCNQIQDLSGLENLVKLNSATLLYNENLINLFGISAIKNLNTLWIKDNDKLLDLNGLDSIQSIGTFQIIGCQILENINQIANTKLETRLIIKDNPELIFCSLSNVCDLLFKSPENVTIENNSENCFNIGSVALACGARALTVQTKVANNTQCDSVNSFIKNEFSINMHQGERHSAQSPKDQSPVVFYTNSNDLIFINFLNAPPRNWSLCNDTLWIDPTQYGDTIHADFLLQPVVDCPELSVDISLPPSFRGCLVTSDMQVRTQNTGTVPAKNVQLAVVLPFDLMEVESVSPLPISQNGDTLFFALGDLDIFEVTDVNLTVRARCDTFLLDHTICIEAFASMDNPCPPSPPVGSLIQTTASCLGNDIVRFTLTNIGDEPTSTPHQYFIIEDVVVLMTQEFDLDVLESMFVDVDATGSTFRMEATKLPDGTLTAAALEGCGGFTPGLINAFWLDEGYSHYDIGCRQVTLAYDPNDKMAIPSGVGPEHLLAANRPIEYTIRFQNTGTDTAYRVLLTDILPPELDVNSFRPGFASHAYTWEIRGLDTLEVLFFPIALPDSAASQEGSQGFFTFSMDQQPNLPTGSMIQNTASIIFDFNPPIITNTVFHTIGQLTVSIDHPQLQAGLWKLQGNPMANQAIFRSTVAIPGAKRFELYDLMGHAVRQEVFHGDEYLFTRGMLRGGMYIFRLIDGEGRQFTGKIILAE